jgi:hypothetical protein
MQAVAVCDDPWEVCIISNKPATTDYNRIVSRTYYVYCHCNDLSSAQICETVIVIYMSFGAQIVTSLYRTGSLMTLLK